MPTNASKVQKVDDLEPGDELYTDSGHVHWVTGIGKNQVTLENLGGGSKQVENSQIECDGSAWSLGSRAPDGERLEMTMSELIAKLQQAVEEQGECKPFFVMEREGDGYSPLTTFEYEIVAENGEINIVCKSGSETPEVPHEKGPDAK
jgi:hypothetical protein